MIARSLIVADIDAVRVGDEEDVGVGEELRRQRVALLGDRIEAHIVARRVEESPEAVLDLECVQNPRDGRVLAVVLEWRRLVDDHDLEGARAHRPPHDMRTDGDGADEGDGERDPDQAELQDAPLYRALV